MPIFGLEYIVAANLALAGADNPYLPVKWGEVECKAQQMNSVSVTWDTERIEISQAKTQAELSQLQVDTKSPYAGHIQTHVGGLMSGEVEIKSNFQFSMTRYPAQKKACIWFDQINVELKIDPTIYIASEFPKGTCKYDAILEHELKHIVVDRQLVEKYAPILQKRLQMASEKVGVVGPKEDTELKVYQQKMQDYMEEAAAPVINALYAERSKNQQAVDNIHEYNRVNEVCN